MTDVRVKARYNGAPYARRSGLRFRLPVRRLYM
eukprot:CAMPEP_0201608994 /NCGR_PEP_ID=MMETSP0492-20130828/10185_1 /ASSEMBLY_ACC=CAM_ASM_000837 /TAXON_ID=420259 /ORGANISM="Thalassiosira gravida, Strain GMp14c1" /LENGTH=32 /DNA_ID= /DNA_START= /DNA_END= /DNA_ORIENTATION=